jgi:hypothetical protein
MRFQAVMMPGHIWFLYTPVADLHAMDHFLPKGFPL